MEGWMNTDTSSYKPSFHKRPGSKTAFGRGTRIRGRSPSSSFDILTTQPLSCFYSVNTEALQAEQHSLYRREWECHLLPPQLSLPFVNLAGADVGLSLLRYRWEGGTHLLLLKKGFTQRFLKQAALPLHLCGIWSARRHSWFHSHFKTAADFLRLPSFFFCPESLELSYVKASLSAFCQIPFSSDQVPS